MTDNQLVTPRQATEQVPVFASHQKKKEKQRRNHMVPSLKKTQFWYHDNSATYCEQADLRRKRSQTERDKCLSTKSMLFRELASREC